MPNNPHPTPVDLLITRAALWSPGGILPHSALAARDGKIVMLGGDELADEVSATETIDAQGGLVTPGFADAHVHAVIAGVERNRCDLSECETISEAETAIAAYAAAHPDEPWILGGGWRMPWFPGGTPRREDLDRLVPDRPAFLVNADHHGAWANSRALELAGITADTPDPVDGRIERDEQGDPSGTLQEGATALLDDVLPGCSVEELRQGILTAEEVLLSHGVIGWQEAILGEYAGYPDATPAYTDLVDSGSLRARTTGALWVSRDFDGLDILGFVDDLIDRRNRFARAGLDLSTAKIMVDGVAENETAALHEPYVDASADCGCSRGLGLAYFSREQLIELVPLLNGAGFNAHFHAIGDRAVTYALDAVAAVDPETRAKRRNHVAHLQLVSPADIPRFRSLNVTANLQALWASIDDQMRDLTLPLIGAERAEWQYPFESLYQIGTTLACGSDWPVSTPDPWQAMHVAVNRRSPGDTETAPLIPAQAVTLETILAAYALGSQRLLGLSGGEITEGAVCDIAIADRNPFAADPSDIYLTRNIATVIDGRIVSRG